ncbi:MAG: light-harvesting protein [Burkholderiales bacterium]|jgi:light-harvesting protein B-800-850 alpha chain
MIYGKMWTVVKPTVGIPVFLGAVAVGSFCVHLAVTTHTTWVSKFLNGEPIHKVAASS